MSELPSLPEAEEKWSLLSVLSPSPAGSVLRASRLWSPQTLPWFPHPCYLNVTTVLPLCFLRSPRFLNTCSLFSSLCCNTQQSFCFPAWNLTDSGTTCPRCLDYPDSHCFPGIMSYLAFVPNKIVLVSMKNCKAASDTVVPSNGPQEKDFKNLHILGFLLQLFKIALWSRAISVFSTLEQGVPIKCLKIISTGLQQHHP